MNSRPASATWDPVPLPAVENPFHEHEDESGPRLAVDLRFHLGELSATAEVMSAAQAAGVQVVALVLRHLGGDWGNVDDATRAANDRAGSAGGPLRSIYPLAGTGDAIVITTDAGREHTVARLASQLEPHP